MNYYLRYSSILFIVSLLMLLTNCDMCIKNNSLIKFDQLKLPTSPNYCLVTSTPYGKRQYLAPTFKVSAASLQETWGQLIQQQPRVTLLQQIKQHLQYVQRSAFFHFPDLIDIQFVTVGQQSSSILMYSRSLYGYYDFGVNCKRVNHWLNLLKNKMLK